MAGAILTIDQGTTNSKAILIAETGEIIARGSAPVGISHPRSGWVVQDANDLWSSQQDAIRACLASAPEVSVTAIGISNQRESVLAWNRKTGAPVGPVISWQCRRTAEACARLAEAGAGPDVLARTGLPLDPMFPATKLAWLLETCAEGRGPDEICLGTVDSWLIWNLTGGAVHATDAANASRTQLLNIEHMAWDDALLDLFGVDQGYLPKVCDSSGLFGETSGVPALPDGIAVAAAIGDSHAALFAQGAFRPGDGKVTFGTGSSIMTTVAGFAAPPAGLTTTIAWALGGTPTYAFEGNILVSAAIFPWTAELLGLDDVDALMALAETVPDSGGVSLVPAHVGLGAPHWSTEARGLISGLSFGSGPAQIARAAADSMALQVRDVFAAIDGGTGRNQFGTLYADGGPTRNPFLMQVTADILDRPIAIRDAAEASALGAGYLAGLATGFWEDRDAIASLIPKARIVDPQPGSAARDETIAAWTRAVARSVMP